MHRHTSFLFSQLSISISNTRKALRASTSHLRRTTSSPFQRRLRPTSALDDDHPPTSISSQHAQKSTLIPRALENAALLNIVPALWGSYGIAAKILYQLDHAVPVDLVNFGGYFFALLSLLAARQLQPRQDHSQSAPSSDQMRRIYQAGFELGAYLYCGSWLNLQALARTSASRCAFLVQLTTVIIPIFDYLLGSKLSGAVWVSCVTALFGAFVLSQGSDPDVAALSPVVFGGLNSGDLLAVLSAAFYSLHVLRLEVLSTVSPSPVLLVQCKAVCQVILSAVSIVFVVASGDNSIASYLSDALSFPPTELINVIWWMFWIGAGTTALATWAQVVGQERVGPSRAAVIYASQPVWAVGLAFALGMDRLTVNECIGGSLIVAAGAIVALSGDKSSSSNLDKDEDSHV